MPRLVRDMIERAIGSQSDMAVVGVVGSVHELVAAAGRTRPHLVVVGLHDERLPPECETVLTEQPSLKVLGIESGAGSALLYELTPRRQAIGSVSPSEVVEAIRSAGARPLFPAESNS